MHLDDAPFVPAVQSHFLHRLNVSCCTAFVHMTSLSTSAATSDNRTVHWKRTISRRWNFSRLGFFQHQQPPFKEISSSSRIVSNLSIAVDDSVARDEQRDGIMSHRLTDGAWCSRIAAELCQVTVRHCLSISNVWYEAVIYRCCKTLYNT